jgi:hypothetical protein
MPNPAKPVEAKRKSRFIGETDIENIYNSASTACLFKKSMTHA